MYYDFVCPSYSKRLFFKINFLGVYLLYNVVLVSTVQQSESAVHVHTSLFEFLFEYTCDTLSFSTPNDYCY